MVENTDKNRAMLAHFGSFENFAKNLAVDKHNKIVVKRIKNKEEPYESLSLVERRRDERRTSMTDHADKLPYFQDKATPNFSTNNIYHQITP